MENLKAKMVEAIKEEMENTGYIDDSDNQESVFYALPKSLLNEEDENYETMKDDLSYFGVGYAQETYKKVSKLYDDGFCTLYYYDNKYDFKDIKELENHFQIGE